MGFSYTLAELAQWVNAEYRGNGAKQIEYVAPLNTAEQQHLSFLSNSKYRAELATTQAGVVVLSPADSEHCPADCIISTNPYADYARLAQRFIQDSLPKPYCHPSAVVHSSVNVPATAVIEPNVVVEQGVTLGEYCWLGPGVIIRTGAKIADHVRLHARAIIEHQVQIGSRTVIGPGAIIGANGFGFAPDKSGYEAIPQLGSAIIAADVDIGANSCIDRGALGDTYIGEGVKIDNLVQVGHNVKIGQHTVIAAGSGIAGSTDIGAWCMLGGQVGVAGHVSIADKVMITGRTLVTGSITEPGVWSSGTTMDKNSTWRRNAVHFKKLAQLVKRVKRLEQQHDR